MSRRATIVLSLLALMIVSSGVGAWWYMSRIEQSRQTGQNISSREVTDSNQPIDQPIQNTDKPQPIIEREQPVLLKKGSFNYLDPVHFGSGDVEVWSVGRDIEIRFLENVKINDGPDLYVYLSAEQDLRNTLNGVPNLGDDAILNLGKLSSTSGAKTYKISQDEWRKYNFAVIIWCRAFEVQFSNARLSQV